MRLGKRGEGVHCSKYFLDDEEGEKYLKFRHPFSGFYFLLHASC